MTKKQGTGNSVWQEQVENGGADVRSISLGKREIIRIDSGEIKNFVQQNSPINNEIARNDDLNDLLGIEIDGKRTAQKAEVTVREKRGRTERVQTLCSFSYDDTVDLDALNSRGLLRITGYDRRVYNAIGTLYLNGRKTVSLTEIFAVMHGYARTNPSKVQLEAVEKSLMKLSSIRFTVDLTEEMKAHLIVDKKPLVEAGILQDENDSIKSVRLEDNMLHYRVGTITSEKGKVFKSIQIQGEPSLLTYNRIKNTLISIPMKYIGLNASSSTEKAISMQDYLLTRIMGYKNGKMRSNKVLYDTLYEETGMEKPKNSSDFRNDREVVKRILAEWVEKGLLTSYMEVKEGRSFAGIVFEVEEKTAKLKK